MKPMSVSAKLSILIVFALLFGATMIALSVRGRTSHTEESLDWGKDNTITKSFAVKAGDKLVLDADQGDVVISGTDSEELNVKVLQKGSDSELKKFHVNFDQSDGIVSIKARHERRYFQFFDNSWLNVRFEIELPKNFNLDLQTAGGDLSVRNVRGTVVGETSGGDVEAETVDGKIKLSTAGGNVKLFAANGEFALSTSGGNITGEDITGSTRAETSGGNIIFKRADGSLHAETSGGDIRVELKDNKGVDLSTSGGNVAVSLPKSITADVRAETTGGDVSCDFPFSGKLKESSLNGKINGGGQLIRLESSGGDIVIHAVE